MDHTLDVKAVNRYKIKPDTGKEFKELNFGITPQNYRKNIWTYMKEFTQI